MSVTKIIEESVNKNPIGLKEAVKEELRTRVALALEAKMKKEEDDMEDDDDDEDDNGDDDDDEDDSIDESASKYGVDTGPLMKASAWIKRQKLSKMVQEEDLRGENLAVGYLEKFGGKAQPIAVAIGKSDEAEMKKYYFKKGLNKPHTFYYDTGRGHRQTDESIIITGIVKIAKDGEVETSGKVDMNASTTLMVFK